MAAVLFVSKMQKLIRIEVLVTILGVLSLFTDYSDGQFTTCVRDYKKIGCFRKGGSKMTLAISDRDGTGPQLDWKQFGRSIHSLACRCAAKARSDDHQYFSIRFYGECWIGKESFDEFEKMVKKKKNEPEGCAGPTYKPCKDEEKTECVGELTHEYIFGVAEWGAWQEWSRCSLTCGGGSQQRRRACNLGDGCVGKGLETRECNNDDCPAEWGTWQEWSRCSLTCGGGSQQRSRACNLGDSCVGKGSETRECNNDDCPAEWGAWEKWSACSLPCGGGRQRRRRACDVDNGCVGQGVETRECNSDDCPSCNWTEKRFGIGLKEVIISGPQNKTACLTACLWKSKQNEEINGVTFKANEPPTCHCIIGVEYSTDDDVSTYCELMYGFPFKR